MLANLRRLVGYRALIQSLVARDLKARYRGSVLGFFWSLRQSAPAAARSIRSSSWSSCRVRAAAGRSSRIRCSSSAACCHGHGSPRRCSKPSTVLISGGNLIRKVLFPAEVLPLVTVLAGLVQLLSRPADRRRLHRVLSACRVAGQDLLWLPLIVAGAAAADARSGAARVGAHRALSRPARSACEPAALWFFATPILYPLRARSARRRCGAVAEAQSVHAPGPAPIRRCCSARRRSRTWRHLLIVGRGVARTAARGYAVFDRLRDTLAEAV